MGDADITASAWRNVEVGRVVLFSEGPYAGKLAAIVEIIDHKRALVEGPASREDLTVPRHAAALSHLSLTANVISGLPRATGHTKLKQLWEKEDVESKFASSNFAKKRAAFAKRSQLSDFERFKVMKMRKQTRFQEKKEIAKLRSSVKA